MITIRRSGERGHTDHGWLDSHHTFSFADYYDERWMGFQALRVINEDRVQPGMGFGTHGHRDMEILSFVLQGALQHRDSLGTGSVIRPGEVQRMSAGRGITHSEFNPSDREVLHFLQVWILPSARGLSPSYEQKAFPDAERQGTLRLVASGDGREGSLTIHQDASVYRPLLGRGQSVTHVLPAHRHAWVHVATGEVLLNGESLQAGDGASAAAGTSLTLTGVGAAADVLLFDLD